MSWRDHLQKAKFRDATFYVKDVDTGIGRRNIIHQYPNKDDPFLEDLGLDVDEISINGYVIQNYGNDFDYFPARNKLMNALKKEGAGTLVHPFLGSMQVCVSGKTRIVEDFSQGGMAKFTMTFVKLSKDTNLGGLSVIDRGMTTWQGPLFGQTKEIIKSGVKEKVDAAWIDSYKKILDNFVAKVSIPDLQFSKKGLIADCTKAISMTKQAIESIRGSIVSNVSDALSILSTNLTNIDSILESPDEFAAWLKANIDVFLYMVGIDTNKVTVGGTTLGGWSGEYADDSIVLDGNSVPVVLGESIVDSLVEMSRFGEEDSDSPSLFGGTLDSINVNTKNRARQSLNRLYMVNTIRNLALATSTRIAVRMSFVSYDKATSIMNTIVDGIENQLIKMGDEAADETYLNYGFADDNNDSYVAMEDLRKEFVTAMRNLGASLAVIVNYTVPPYGITALELAYNRYYNLDRLDDIFKRNQPTVIHPGFLRGGSVIEILSE